MNIYGSNATIMGGSLGRADAAIGAVEAQKAQIPPMDGVPPKGKFDTNGDGEFNFFFKVENMKLLDGTYDVEISSKNISHYKNKSYDIEYWIALEPESTYKV